MSLCRRHRRPERKESSARHAPVGDGGHDSGGCGVTHTCESPAARRSGFGSSAAFREQPNSMRLRPSRRRRCRVHDPLDPRQQVATLGDDVVGNPVHPSHLALRLKRAAPLVTRRPEATRSGRDELGVAPRLGSHGADVLGFLALAAGPDLELDRLALGQGRAAGLKVGDVHEHVLAAIPGDETEPSVLIEELHFALHNGTTCLSRPTHSVGRHWTVRAWQTRSSLRLVRPWCGDVDTPPSHRRDAARTRRTEGHRPSPLWTSSGTQTRAPIG